MKKPMDSPSTLRQAYQHALWAFIDRAETTPLVQALTSMAHSVHLSPSLRRLALLAKMILADWPAHAPVADWAQWYARIDRLLSAHEHAALSPEQLDRQAQQLTEQLLHQQLFQTLDDTLALPNIPKAPASTPPDRALLLPERLPNNSGVLAIDCDDPAAWVIPPTDVDAIITPNALAQGSKPAAPRTDASGNASQTAKLWPLGTLPWDEQTIPVVALTPVNIHTSVGCVVIVHTPKEVATAFAYMGIFLDRRPDWVTTQADHPHRALDRVALARAINACGYFDSCCSR